MSTLHLFDIDGTLTRSSSVDHSCYIDAFRNVFNLKISVDNWCIYPFVTDWGLAEHIWQHEYSEQIPPLELQKLQDEFMRLLTLRYEDAPDHISEIPGSKAYFYQLIEEKQPVAFATGCWRRSALFKLDKIGIDARPYPLGNSDLHPSRVEIMKKAIKESTQHYAGISDVIYYGDGTWDFQACKELDIPLIGIDGEKTKKLVQLGHHNVHHDYHTLSKQTHVYS